MVDKDWIITYANGKEVHRGQLGKPVINLDSYLVASDAWTTPAKI